MINLNLQIRKRDVFLSFLLIGVLVIVGYAASEPLAAPYQAKTEYEQSIIKAVDTASPAVVSIAISKKVAATEDCPIPPEFKEFFDIIPQCAVPGDGSTIEEVGGGSGFAVSSDGLIVTNKHVVSDKEAVYSVILKDGSRHTVEKILTDPNQDIAIIKIKAANLPTVELGDSDSVVLGQSAIAIGNALAKFANTISVGIVSGTGRSIVASGAGGVEEVFEDVLQTDAAINLGNSGGPLLNLKGEVIGVNTAIATNAQNIGFAIPINKIKQGIESVRNQ
ncbi:trypsin-like peptidase domain-containing protein [Candidatus Giovannonibacteria bacterium]|nr:trypsin-like peptidase domain-containing protein [Candidatus Giovannonibacteria bacterium]